MEYFKKRQKTRRRMYSKLTIAGLTILLALLIRPTWDIFQKSLESKRNLDQARAELAVLEARKQSLSSDVAYIKSDHGRDQEIRDKFGVAKEGETMVVIVRGDEPKKTVTPPPEPGFWQKNWSRFLSAVGLQ